MTITTNELVSDFEAFARENGYSLPPGRIAEFIDKPSPLRFSRDGGRDLDCFAYLKSKGVGTLGDWHDLEGSKVIFNFYKRNGQEISEEDRKALEKEARELDSRAKEEMEKTWKQKALECASEFENLPGMETPVGYFARKCFSQIAGDIRMKGETAVVPFFDGEGLISTLQDITPEGIKRWRSGAKKASSFFPIGLKKAEDREKLFRTRVYICEGVATGLSVYLATGVPTIVAGDAGNLLPVSRLFSNSTIVADYDIPSHAGEEYAKETGRPYIVVKDPEDASAKFDADDHRRKYGLKALGDFISSHREDYFLSLSQFRNKFRHTGYVVKHIINKSSVNCIFGPSNAGKTFVMLDLALSVATGKEAWHGAKIHPGPVAYFCAEGQAAFPKRVEAWCQENGIEERALEGEFWLHGVPEYLSNEATMEKVISEIDALPALPILVCLDTFIRFLEGDEKNSEDVTKFLNSLEQLTAKGISVLYTNHPGKNPDAQGSQTGSYRNRTNIDTELCLEKSDAEVVRLYHTKPRDGLFYELFLRLPIVEMGIDEDGEPITQRVVRTETPLRPLGEAKQEVSPSEKQVEDAHVLMKILHAHEPKIEGLEGEVEISRDEAKKVLTEHFLEFKIDEAKVKGKVKESLVTSKNSWLKRCQKEGWISSISSQPKQGVTAFRVALENLPKQSDFMLKLMDGEVHLNKE